MKVNPQALAQDLEAGIAKTDAWFADMPREYMLRTSVCGLVATAIHGYLQRGGINSELKHAEFRLGPATVEHIFPVVSPAAQDAIVIDAAYSQFFNVVGLSYPYGIWSGADAFPERKILVFNAAKRSVATRWMAMVAVNFQGINTHPVNDLGWDMGEGPLTDADSDTIRREYAALWDLSGTTRWAPTAEIVKAGEVIADCIRTDSICLK